MELLLPISTLSSQALVVRKRGNFLSLSEQNPNSDVATVGGHECNPYEGEEVNVSPWFLKERNFLLEFARQQIAEPAWN